MEIEQDINWRMRRLIENKLYSIRFIQKGIYMPTSEVLKIFGKVLRETGGDTEDAYLIYLIHQLEKAERRRSSD